jgi:putative zinc finger/helix-turn-helix YgiT family protein
VGTVLCTSCRSSVAAKIESRIETFPVRGEDVEVESQVAVCPKCGEDLWLEELDQLALQKAFQEYRIRHGLLSPEEIRQIRERYGLSQRAFSLLLGWGEITVHRYEAGSLQDSAHDAQLRMAADPRNMALLLTANGGRLTARQKTHLERALADHQVGVDSRVREQCWSFMTRAADAYSGFRAFDEEKFSEMVVYFSDSPGVFRTKLNKLLFYADFLNFKQSAVSISGAPYLAFQRGPVPEHYDWMTQDLEQRGDVQTTEWISGDKSGEIITALRPAETSVFSESEMRVLESVRALFQHTTSKELTDLSHAEAAYANTAPRQKISYHWAGELSVSLAG